ncbi:hypothetical protein FF011L_14320 [Roseimaritima multifibrata]|uniref:Uncharacterized protein n=1 Tax=Roseimaritima multifibrata TaxID=1930274 RepID=A0A517MCR9_9BACT|nr:hypothetical protein FF011L_14320 [Roseimaritima multifibrata]
MLGKWGRLPRFMESVNDKTYAGIGRAEIPERGWLEAKESSMACCVLLDRNPKHGNRRT